MVLTDGVAQTLFGEYASHRKTDRGAEEYGWLLLGLRQQNEAIVLATLPAGAHREADEVHVQFDPTVQALASTIVRQGRRQLTTIGVVHTHPGSLRHPSHGDYVGDVTWVTQLRGEEGVFAIGTADASAGDEPRPIHVRAEGELQFSWYALGRHDRNYRALKVEVQPGPDLAMSVRTVWEELETHASRLDQLTRMLNGVKFQVAAGHARPALLATIPRADDGHVVLVQMEGKAVRYRVIGPDGAMAPDLHEDRVDVGVFLLLAELAAQQPSAGSSAD